MAIEIGDAILKLKADGAEFIKGIKDAKSKAATAFGEIKKNSTAVGGAITAFGAAAVGGLAAAGKNAAEFGKAMSNVSTLGVQDLGALKEGVRDVAKEMGINATQAATDLYDVISAGMPEDAAIRILESASKGAKAGVGELSSALDAGTSIMNAYNLKGKDAEETARNFKAIQGKLATAIKVGKTNMDGLGSAMGQIAPLASEAGMGVDSLLANIAALTTTGQSASEAATGLKASLTSVLKPSETAKKLTGALGIEFNGAALKAEGYTEFMRRVVEQLKAGNPELLKQRKALEETIPALTENIAQTKAQILELEKKKTRTQAEEEQLKKLKFALKEQNAELKKSKADYKELKKVGENWQGTAANIFGSVEALNAIMATTGSKMDVVTQATNDMANAQENLNTMFDAAVENDPTWHYNQMKSSIADLGITVGDVVLHAMQPLIETITKVVDWIAKFAEKHPVLMGGLVAIAGVLGTIALVVGPIIIALPLLAAGFTTLGAVFTAVAGFASTMWIAITGPIGLAIIAIVAVGAALWVFRDKVMAALKWIVKAMGFNWDQIVETVSNAWEKIKEFFFTYGPIIWDTVKGMIGTILTFIKEAVILIWDILEPFVKLILKLFGWQIKAIWTVLKTLASWIVKGWNTGKEWISTAIDWVSNAITKAIDTIKKVFGTVKDIILWPFKAAFAGVIKVVNAVIEQINKLKVAAPDWDFLPDSIQGKSWGFDIPTLDVPEFAKGGITKQPWSIVGEKGPELLRAPIGSQIFSNAKSQEMMGGTFNFNVSIGSVNSESEAKRYGKLMGDEFRRQMRLSGVAVPVRG